MYPVSTLFLLHNESAVSEKIRGVAPPRKANMNLKTPNQARNDGSELTDEDIEQFKTSIQGTIVTKADTPEEAYNAAVERWNRVYIKQAV